MSPTSHKLCAAALAALLLGPAALVGSAPFAPVHAAGDGGGGGGGGGEGDIPTYVVIPGTDTVLLQAPHATLGTRALGGRTRSGLPVVGRIPVEPRFLRSRGPAVPVIFLAPTIVPMGDD